MTEQTPAPASRRGRDSTILDGTLTTEQLVGELSALRIPPGTISALCEIVPVIRYVLGARRRSPTLTAQRNALEAMANAADAALAAFEEAWDLSDAKGLGMALRARLDDVSADRAHEELDTLLDSLTWARQAAKAARANMRGAQARSRAATTPIRLIHERLALAPSTSSEGRFRMVTVLLYKAAGFPYENPDAGIRAHLKALDSR